MPYPPPPPKTQLDILDLENFLVKLWGGDGGGGVVCHAIPPPTTTTPKVNLTFWTYKIFLSKFDVVVVVGGMACPLHWPNSEKKLVDFGISSNFLQLWFR